MAIQAVLFDLDGTLLPMDQDVFIKGYFSLLARKAAPLGYEPEGLISAVWKGTAAMVHNDGSCTNEQAFWRTFVEIYGAEKLSDRAVFDEFYREEFQQVQQFCGFNPAAAQTVQALRAQGLRLALATNPIFPAVATEHRIGWAGLKPSDFECITTYENSDSSKPNPRYYRKLAEQLDLAPEQCLMVGNDVGEDMIAETIGMHVFLLTDCLISRDSADISAWPHGGFAALMDHVRELQA